ncbi:hypothetical protein [Priestia aryabhattai]|uniref:hypothetical protein n=1 Tax=Priestia aryabhattai TaxID=412384 RepID=UPI001C8E16E0|nr:hypothetical protein [Priestia aryabhattai]MBX9988383.1 hypothetical protein [Priestia aryabhattai]
MENHFKENKKCYRNKINKKIDLAEANLLFESGNADITISTRALSDQDQGLSSTNTSNGNSVSSANPVSESRARGIDGLNIELGNLGDKGGKGGKGEKPGGSLGSFGNLKDK